MTTEPTPGAWSYRPHPNLGDYGVSYVVADTEAGPVRLAGVLTPMPERPPPFDLPPALQGDRDANGRLLAAAPALADACRTLLRAASGYTDIDHALHAAREALALCEPAKE